MMKQINRRDFFKITGTAATGTALASCGVKQESAENLVPEGQHTTELPKGKMTYRTNPKNGDKVSLLGYGWMRLPKMKDPGNPNEEIINQEEVNRLCNKALEYGVNYFDTSPAYVRGKSEESLGIALEQSGRSRDSYYIATKLSNFSPTQWSFEAGKEMFENSLKYLKTDYVDYLLLHSVGSSMDNLQKRYFENGLLAWLMEQREAGRIRNLGFSFHGDVSVYDYLLSRHDEFKWDFVQIQLNYIDWHDNNKGRDAEYLYGELVKRNIPAVIMEPLLGGRLSKVPDHVVAHLKSRKPEDSVASWAFRYAGTPELILTVLSGMTYMEHLEDNIRTYSPLVPLTEEEARWLDGETANLIESYPTIPCNDCQYCMPCPYGLDIPSILLHYNKCVNQGNVPESQQAENYHRARRAFLVGYDRSVPRLRQANRCISCRECVSHCPQNIDIPRELQRIDRFVEKLKQDKW